MALSGTIYSSWREQRRLQIDWRVTEQSIENNTSKIKITMRCYCGQYTFFNSDAYRYRFNGETHTNSKTALVNAGEYINLITFTTTVNHADDGSGVFPIYLAYPYYNTAHTLILDSEIVVDSIPRATTPTVGAVVLGSAATITVAPVISTWVHSLRWSCGTASGTIANRTAETEIEWTPPETLGNQFATDSATATLTIDCDTYNGETLIGTKHVATLASMPDADGYRPDNVQLTIGTGTTAGSAVDFDSARIYVQGKTTVPVSVSAACKYGATVASAAVSIDGISFGVAPVNVPLTMSGNNSIVANVTDTRGLTNSGTTTIRVEPYHAPTITSCVVTRCNADGTANEDGEHVHIVATTNVSSVSNHNVKTYIVKSKSAGGDYSTIASGTLSAYENNGLDVVLAGFSANTTYDVQLLISDAFSTTRATRTVQTTENVFDINASGKGFAFGKASESDALECDFPAEFNDDVVFNGFALNLWHSIGQTRSGVLSQGTDFNDVKTIGLFGINRTDYGNQPTAETGTLIVRSGEGAEIDITRPWCYLQQIFIPRTPTAIYMRSIIAWGTAGAWNFGRWYKFSGEQI